MEEIHSCGVPNKNIRYIENGVDTGRFNPDCDATGVTKEYDLPTDKPLLLFLGRLKGQKRPELLIKRFAKISNALDGDITLAVAGKGTRGEAARKVAETHCGDNIKFLGCVPERDKAPLYVAADYYVLPSSYEGSPLALYEALASGTPAIVSDLPGTRFVAEEQCGIVVDFEDDSDVERIAEYITADDDHSSYARNYAETNLDWSTRTKEYQEEFQRMYE
jgi:glycosyltransferase involved in cell wall biosynthesis